MIRSARGITLCARSDNGRSQVINRCDLGRWDRADIEAKSIWAGEKAMPKKFFERFNKEFLNQPLPLRTDFRDGQDAVVIHHLNNVFIAHGDLGESLFAKAPDV